VGSGRGSNNLIVGSDKASAPSPICV
jgi:hypothetical protein